MMDNGPHMYLQYILTITYIARVSTERNDSCHHHKAI